jgi:uncharacterized membrane protein
MDPQPLIAEKNIHRIFEISVILKGLHALIEIVGGIFLYVVSADAITSFMIWLAEADLLGDPHDIISNYLLHAAQGFSVGSKNFAAFYLLSHGLIKVVLVAGLLRNKYWAYPSSLIVLGLFILYQVYRYTFTHSIWLIALTVFDLVVMWLIWHEYKLVRAHKPLE